MKAWQLTIDAVPFLRKVLDAVSRTQLDSYGIERNFRRNRRSSEVILALYSTSQTAK